MAPQVPHRDWSGATPPPRRSVSPLDMPAVEGLGSPSPTISHAPRRDPWWKRAAAAIVAVKGAVIACTLICSAFSSGTIAVVAWIHGIVTIGEVKTVVTGAVKDAMKDYTDKQSALVGDVATLKGGAEAELAERRLARDALAEFRGRLMVDEALIDRMKPRPR